MTAAGSRPARRARSQPASVCPARVSTPPGCAISGKMWPGWRRSLGCARRRDGRLNRARAIVRRDAGRHALGRFDRDREIRGLTNVGIADHQRQAQLLATRARQREANQPAAVLRHEVDVFGAHLRGRHDEIAFVLALLVVENHDHLARANRRDDVVGRVQSKPRRYRWSRAYPCFLKKARSMPLPAPASARTRRSR